MHFEGSNKRALNLYVNKIKLILDNNKTNLGAIASPEKWYESEWVNRLIKTFFLPQPLKSSSIQSENERDRKGERER